jgi:hypothetical protein
MFIFFFLLSWLLLGGFRASSLLFGFGASSVDRLIILPSPLLFQPSPTQSCIERKGRKKGRKKERQNAFKVRNLLLSFCTFSGVSCSAMHQEGGKKERKEEKQTERVQSPKVFIERVASFLPPSHHRNSRVHTQSIDE